MQTIMDLTSAETVVIRAPHNPEFISIRTQEDIVLGEREIGIILGKKSHMLRGAICQSGIVNPGWHGCLEPFFIVYGNWNISVGEKIAHLVIFSS